MKFIDFSPSLSNIVHKNFINYLCLGLDSFTIFLSKYFTTPEISINLFLLKLNLNIDLEKYNSINNTPNNNL